MTSKQCSLYGIRVIIVDHSRTHSRLVNVQVFFLDTMVCVFAFLLKLYEAGNYPKIWTNKNLLLYIYIYIQWTTPPPPPI